jgi:hypothetical protein
MLFDIKKFCLSGEFTRLHESSHFMTCNPDEIVKILFLTMKIPLVVVVDVEIFQN